MKKLMFVALAFASIPALAQNVDAPPGYADLATLEVPVVAEDITDRPYRVLGTVQKGVRKATVFSKSPSEAKVYRELWESAEKMGADAVVFAEYGEARITGLSWGSREARGKAIKFLTDAEIAEMKRLEQGQAIADAGPRPDPIPSEAEVTTTTPIIE